MTTLSLAHLQGHFLAQMFLNKAHQVIRQERVCLASFKTAPFGLAP